MKNINDKAPWEPFEVREHKGKGYDLRSAMHNGLVGPGKWLKEIIKRENHRTLTTKED